MEKTGRRRIPDYEQAQKNRRCANCGGEGEYKITYEDMYGKLVVTLCEKCEWLEYGELKLQSRFAWPGIA